MTPQIQNLKKELKQLEKTPTHKKARAVVRVIDSAVEIFELFESRIGILEEKAR